MGKIRILVLLALAVTSLSVAQDRNTGVPGPNQAIVNPEAQSPSVRILTPVAGQTISTNFVNLKFELTRPALNGEPNFLVQLDASDPISTTSTSYTFSSLQPGVHSVRVTLVDANNTPVQGGTATVQFKVPATNAPARTDSPRGAMVQDTGVALAQAVPSAPIPPELRRDGDLRLPLAGSPLPLLSIIGFGLLLGGAAHTMRSR